MPIWTPEPRWQGEDVFIIGGGSSLKYFNWNLLRNELTIGCNSAFTLGSKICKVCIFGDLKWFKKFKDEFETFQGVIFTNNPQLVHSELDWLWTMRRENHGLHKEALGWNACTGALAINLALLLGAKRVFLLGFDMALDKVGKPNWHTQPLIDRPRNEIYDKFVRGMKRVAADLPKVFPGTEIINVTDCSNLDVFPKVGFRAFWNERLKGAA